MVEEKLVNCPFCKQMTVKILHQPFVARKGLTKSRFGAGGPVYTKEKTEVLSGCDACGKSQKEVEKELDGEGSTKSHEERLKRFQAMGLPTKIVNKRE
jgi:hypothetical protein